MTDCFSLGVVYISSELEIPNQGPRGKRGRREKQYQTYTVAM